MAATSLNWHDVDECENYSESTVSQMVSKYCGSMETDTNKEYPKSFLFSHTELMIVCLMQGMSSVTELTQFAMQLGLQSFEDRHPEAL